VQIFYLVHLKKKSGYLISIVSKYKCTCLFIILSLIFMLPDLFEQLNIILVN